jgi:hypothetical protein
MKNEPTFLYELNSQELEKITDLKDNLETSIQDLFDWFEDKGYNYDLAAKHIMVIINSSVRYQ